MEVRSYKASSLKTALQLVHQDLGPDAAVLETRRLWGGALGRILGLEQVEVTASNDVNIPGRFAVTARSGNLDVGLELGELESDTSAEVAPNSAPVPDEELSLDDKVAMLRESAPAVERFTTADIQLCADLVEAEIDADLAREIVQSTVGAGAGSGFPEEVNLSHRRNLVRQTIADGIPIQGEIDLPEKTPPKGGRVVALVGPTGVGKTTTIAKLAANFRLRERRKVGLITVDTYRIAAVEQLKTYANIIDLPMEVVSTERELRAALNRLSHLDLILMDTAGRSPQSESELQDLRTILNEAQPDEVHLVLSVASSSRTLIRTAEQFAPVGTTSLILTKLDESPGLGNLLPVWRDVPLPVSYVTNGQNVPDDILTADANWLAEQIVPVEDSADELREEFVA